MGEGDRDTFNLDLFKRISFCGCMRVKLEGLGHDQPLVVFRLRFCCFNNNNNNNNLCIYIAQASRI